jgi:hypothetical protein
MKPPTQVRVPVYWMAVRNLDVVVTLCACFAYAIQMKLKVDTVWYQRKLKVKVWYAGDGRPCELRWETCFLLESGLVMVSVVL